MQKQYEAPELTFIGRTENVVLGPEGCGMDFPEESAADFEFEQD